MNEETNDDILDVTGTTTKGYAVAVSMFSLAYATFEVPSNWIMKRFVRPSLWLGFLLFGWGALTMGFTGVQTYAQVVVLRFLIGKPIRSILVRHNGDNPDSFLSRCL